MKAQDEDAWRRFVHLYSPLVYRWCRLAGLQEADAADVGQEVFRAVAGAIAAYHHDRQGDSFRGWLRTITRNKVYDCLARRPPHEVSVHEIETVACAEVNGAVLEPDESSVQEEKDLLFRRAVDTVLADCEQRTRMVFWRVVVNGQHPTNVAQDFNMTAGAVYSIKSRILRRIREEYAGLIDG